ncbi:MAG: ornithine carbamoyltransferase, partial [Thermoguttaceae bacterium]|nr:ornithine carbamoyltransferase [Thermoguttaceae bacterium]
MKSVRHFLDLRDCTIAEVQRILAIADELKVGYFRGERPVLLERKVLGMIFEKMSLRTRVSF